MDLIQRPRRLRGSENLRKMVRETRMDKSSLIYPLFVKEGTGIEEEIPSMEGQFRYSVDRLPFELERLQNAGVNSIMLFGIPDHKDEVGSGAYDPNGIVQKALREAKKQFPDMYYITDVCMCEYTSHGHCGVLCGHDVNNDATLELLAKTAVSHVEAGADMVAPSDMMDGRVRAIREALDANGHYGAPIMSYAVKYASAFYGPFRDAAGSAPSFGDRKSYQMDFHNRREGMKEALTDVEEGADIIMVKPAMSYLDMVSEVSKAVNVPVATYSVSGEYAMVKAAAKMGWIDEERIMCEMAVSAYRAGAQIYLTYYAKELARFILHLIDTNEYGTYHATNKGVCSRYEFAHEILKLTGKEAQMKAVPTHLSDFSKVRPAYCVLDNFIMSMTPVYTFPSWKESLKEYFKERGLYNEK